MSARCRHENADHLAVGDGWALMDGTPMPDALVEQLRCLNCGAWLSLSPANDEPAEELEAAKIIADVMANVEHITDWQIAIGMAAYDADNDPPLGGLAWMWHAGWLARHIWITHDATHEHEGKPLTLAEVKDALAVGREERRQAEQHRRKR